MTQEEIDALVATKVAEAITATKQKLDGAYGRRDEAVQALSTVQQELDALKATNATAAAAAQAKKLEDEGKLRESFDLQMQTKDGDLAKATAALRAHQEKIVVLTRDNALRAVLTGHSFRNERAADMAYNAVVGTLVEKEGAWVTPEGKDIATAVSDLVASEDYAFLITPKPNSGSGHGAGKPTNNVGQKARTDMTTSELIEAQIKGTL